jgi:hypothetical protein
MRGVALGLTVQASQQIALSVVEQRALPRGSALTNASRQIFQALGVAILATIVTTVAGAPPEFTGAPDPAALQAAYQASFLSGLEAAYVATFLGFDCGSGSLFLFTRLATFPKENCGGCSGYCARTNSSNGWGRQGKRSRLTKVI